MNVFLNMYWVLPILLLLLVCFFATGKRYRWIYIIYKTLPRDIIAFYRFIKLNIRMRKWEKAQMTVPKAFAEVIERHPNKVAFYFEDDTWTYKKLDEFSNQVANYFVAQGYQKGDTIALLLENRAEYVGLWLGLSKAGLITALINTNLVSLPLHHSVTVAHSKAIIYGSDFINAIGGIKDQIQDVQLYEFNMSSSNSVIEGSVALVNQLKEQSILRPMVQISPRDKVIYIYTSGTTGLPKAANISHSRYMYASLALYQCINLNEHDIFYNPLPLYHASGGMVAVGQTLIFGISGVIRRKFSATNFWTDCLKYKCTVANYIGETCRYILAAHKNGIDFRHKVKKMAGNGLRKEIWQTFKDTFNIAEIYEFYGATEGNANLVNIDNTVGAVGFLPVYSSAFSPVSLIRCHEDTNEPMRNKDGRCIRCKPGEPGIIIGKIIKNNNLNEFTGYADKKESGKKVLTDVFEAGDSYFNSGDVLVQDELGYFYFKDRTGDTYRWKGENVATREVESVLSGILGLTELVVYGVEVPGNEGKAGMITVSDAEKNLDIDELAISLKTHLPSYAVPLFLRVTNALPMTGTFKVKKNELQKEGFDMEVVKDMLYFYDAKNVKYVPLAEVYSDIINGTRKL